MNCSGNFCHPGKRTKKNCGSDHGCDMACVFQAPGDNMKKKTLLSWSSGKDSAWALHVLRQQPDMEVSGLFCTVNQKFERVAMHAVRTGLIHQQAESIGFPVELIQIPYPCSDSEYEAIMKEFTQIPSPGILRKRIWRIISGRASVLYRSVW